MTYELSSLHRKYYGASYSPQEPDAERCCESIMGDWHSRQCHRKRGYGPEEAYCKQHDPVAVKARNDASSAKWHAEFEASMEKQKLARNAQNFLDALRLIANGHNDPRSLALEAIKDFPIKEGE